MNTNENAPRNVGSTSIAAASSDRSGWPASIPVIRSESLVALGEPSLVGSMPCAASTNDAASSAVLVKFPLCPNAIPPPLPDERYEGCAFSQVHEPVVE